MADSAGKRSYCITSRTERIIETIKDESWKTQDKSRGEGTGLKDKSQYIGYQNKDIVSKLFGERMKGKSLLLFGLGTDLKVVDAKRAWGEAAVGGEKHSRKLPCTHLCG